MYQSYILNSFAHIFSLTSASGFCDDFLKDNLCFCEIWLDCGTKCFKKFIFQKPDFHVLHYFLEISLQDHFKMLWYIEVNVISDSYQ